MIALFGAAFASVLVMLLCLVRLLSGPTLHDRLLAANGMALSIVAAACCICVYSADAHSADVAIVLLLSLVVADVAMMKLFYSKSFQPAMTAIEDNS
jgi:multicomponent Na+:H+ antiporter subunit F